MRLLPGLCLFLAGCAAAPERTAPEMLSVRAIVLDVPFRGQSQGGACGLSSLEMLAAWFGRPLREADLSVLREEAGRREGLTARAITGALESSGYDAVVFEGRLDDSPAGLERHLRAGRPLLVLLGTDGLRSHFVLVTGFDPEGRWWVLHDPKCGRVALSESAFGERWRSCGRLAIVAVPRVQPE